MFEELSQRMPALTGSAVQYIVTFAGIFAVLAVLALLVRRLGARRSEPERDAGQRGRRARLGIVDIYEMDAQRRLILLRRDGVEHLLLVGGPNDLLVESHIDRSAAARYETVTEFPETGPDRIGEPPPPRTARTEPTFPPSLPPRPRPVPEPVIPPPLPEATAIPVDDVRRAPAGILPVEKPAAADTAGQRRLDPGILSDMARQLETALAAPMGPTMPVPPKDGATETSPEEGNPKGQDSAPEPSAVTPGPVPDRGKDAVAPSRPTVVPASAQVELRPADKPVSPQAPVERPKGEPVKEPPAGERRPSALDMFSVDEIEAEFARLLGRPKDGG